MEAVSIRFLFDYVDPGSYLATRWLERWQKEHAIPLALEWAALELRVPGARPIDPADPTWSAMTEAMRDQARRAGIPFEVPSHVPWTRKSHELALHAHEKGCFDPVHRALFEAHFVDRRDIGRVDVLVELAEAEGLDPAEARTVLGVDRFGPDVEARREEALARGIRGVPTLEVDEWRLGGLETTDALEAFLRRVTEEFTTSRSDQTR